MNLPFEIKNIDELCRNNENGKSGYYPIGTGNFWHSGIHINKDSKEEFVPIIPGIVVMYRISQDYKKMNLPDQITESDYTDIFAVNKDKYEKNGRNYSLKKGLSDTEKQFPVSDNFIMLKHNLKIKQLADDSFVFYTLYMNLAPLKEYDKSCYDGNIVIGDAIQFPAGEGKEFSVAKIGMPGLNNTERYFDFVVITEKSLFDYKQKMFLTDEEKQELFIGLNKNVTLYRQKRIESKSSTYYIPSHTEYEIKKTYTDSNRTAKKIKITAIRIYLSKNKGMKNGGEKFSSGKSYEVSDVSTIWIGDRKIITDGSCTESDIGYFYAVLCTKIKSIVGKKIKVVYVTPGGQPAINIDFSDLGIAVHEFWTVSDSDCFTVTGKVTETKKITAYNENPLLCDYEKMDQLSDENKKMVTDVEKNEYMDRTENIFYKVVSDQEWYISKVDKKKCFEPAFAWDKWFLNYKEDSGKSDDIFCDRTSVMKESIKWYEDMRVKYALLLMPLSPWWFGTYIIWDYLKYLFGNGEKYEFAHDMCSQLRKCVCMHPLEWDQTKFSDIKDKKKNKKWAGTISDSQAELLKDIAKNTDIWKDGLQKIFGTNQLHFVHPVYFINHLERAGAFEFNPYLGLTYKGVKVKDNPGFAPYTGIGTGINGYSQMSWEFNGTSDASTKHHAGIDFEINYKDNGKIPIYSLINGIVIANIDYNDKNFGNCILVENTFMPNCYYIVAHMNRDKEYAKKGDKVYPGMIVGYVGNTGKMYTKWYRSEDGKDEQHITSQLIDDKDRPYGYGAHLHVQFIISDKLDNVYNNAINVFKSVDSRSFNPIEHTIPWNENEVTK
jgi:hypothetical protein